MTFVLPLFFREGKNPLHLGRTKILAKSPTISAMSEGRGRSSRHKNRSKPMKETDPEFPQGMKREKKIALGVGGLIHFSVMIGEVLSLRALSVTESFLKTFGLSRFDHILRKASSALVSSTRGLVSDSYRFGRFWKDKTYALEGLEEIARRIDPNHWQHLIPPPSGRSGLPGPDLRMYWILFASVPIFSFTIPKRSWDVSFFGGQVRLLPMRQAFMVAMTLMGSLIDPSRWRNY